MRRLMGTGVRLTVGGVEVPAKSVSFDMCVSCDSTVLSNFVFSSGRTVLQSQVVVDAHAFEARVASLPPIDGSKIPDGPRACACSSSRKRNVNMPRSGKRNAWRRRACGRRAKHGPAVERLDGDHLTTICLVCKRDTPDVSPCGELYRATAPRILKRRAMAERRRVRVGR